MEIDLQLESSEWHTVEIKKFIEKYHAATKKNKQKLKSQIPYLLGKLRFERANLEKLISE